MRGEPWPQPSLQAEEQDIDETRNHRRYGERQIDQRDQHLLAAKIEFGDRPGGGEAECEVEWYGNAGRDQGKLERLQCVGLDQCRKISVPSLGEGLGEYGDERQKQEGSEYGEGGRREQPAHPHCFAGRASRCR